MSLLDDLISYWKLDEASGNAIDAHGTHDLTETGGTIGATTGKVGGARDFEADDTEWFEIASNADLQTGNIDFTISVWVQAESLGAERFIATKGWDGSSDTSTEWRLYYDVTADRFVFVITASFGGSAFDITVQAGNLGAPSTGTWYHIVAWHDATNDEIGIAVNAGTPDTADEVLGSGPFAAARPFIIGARNNATPRGWDGLIDEFGFWKRLLTSDERTELYNSGNGLSYDDFAGGGATEEAAAAAAVELDIAAAGGAVHEAALALRVVLGDTVDGGGDFDGSITLAGELAGAFAAEADAGASAALGVSLAAAAQAYREAAADLAAGISQAVTAAGGMDVDADASAGLGLAIDADGSPSVEASISLTQAHAAALIAAINAQGSLSLPVAEAATFAAAADAEGAVPLTTNLACVILSEALALAGVSVDLVQLVSLVGAEVTIVVTPCCRTVRVRVEVRTVVAPAAETRVVRVRWEDRTVEPPCDC